MFERYIKNYDILMAILYSILALLLHIYAFSFYPIPISMIIILTTFLLMYFKKYKICMAFIIFTLIPALLYTFKNSIIGVSLMSLLLILFLKFCNAYDFLIIMLCLSIFFTSFNFLAIPILLVSSALVPKGYGSNTIKISSLFVILYFIILTLSSTTTF